MKKFLSLVLAMIMTLSLVTISAGATEYKDLTDKDEIQYEEAVAVLNRIGVITGYEDGTFRPETELTRGAAAKIIVSLMIGPDAAGALSNNTSPYPDVPAGHTFAGVISYCKTAGYISGYGDGNFKPAGTLTGFAFSKMLLGALGYKSDIEGFVDTGWTNNVARIGNVAGLFDRISFDGAAAVNRDQACQLALNTLKATMVTYDKTTITGATGTYVMQGEAVPVTSNNRDINANIGRKDWYGGNNKGSDYLTLEFGEEHFKDLRLEYDRFDPAHDEFGRPSNEWSYKKVTIGTFPLEADRTYTTQVAHVEDSDGTKEKNLNLRNYDLEADGGYSVWTGWGNTGAVTAKAGDTTVLWMNGLKDEDYFDQVKDSKTNKKVADIADFTDNGTLVEVYVSEVDADWITDVVVIQTQLMEVDKVASNYVSLKQQEPDVEKGNPNGTPRVGFNQAAIDVEIEDVKDDNEDCYTILKGLKSGDDIAVVPVTTDSGKTYDAAEVYVPETVSGTWTRVDTYGKIVDKESQRSAISITVGGTEYKLADWNDKMYDKTDADIKATRKDVTLIMDKYGNAMKAKDIGDTTGFMVIGNFYQSLVGSKISTFVHGWDINGKEIDLNLGSNVKYQNHNSVSGYGHELGELVRYDSKAATGDADYALTHANVHSVFYYLNDNNIDTVNPNFETKKNTLRLPLSNTHAAWSDGSGVETANSNGHFCNDAAIRDDIAAWDGKNVDDLYTRYTFADDVKFIYVTYDGDDEVDSVEFKDGRQNVDTKEFAQKLGKDFIYSAQASVKDDKITSVVIKQESADASLNRMLYVINYTGFNEYDRETGRTGIGVLVARFTTDGKFEDEVEMIVDKNLAIGAFASYNDTGSTTINGKEIDHYYHVKTFTRHNSNPAVLFADYSSKVTLLEDGKGKVSKYLLRLHDVQAIDVNGNATGPILVADPGADGEGANDATESYLMSKYRSHGSVVDDAYNDAEGIIWTNDAQWINVTKDAALDKVDSTEDLNDFMDEHDATVELTVLLNENPDSDDFRVAYLIILTEVHYKQVVNPVKGTVIFRDENGKVLTASDDVYFTTDVDERGNNLKVGDTFRVTTKGTAEIIWKELIGVTYQADNENKDSWFFTLTDSPATIYIDTKYVTPPTPAETAKITIEYVGAATDVDGKVSAQQDGAAVTEVEKNSDVTVAGLESGYRAVVVVDGKIVEVTGAYTVAADTTIYVEKASVSYDLVGGFIVEVTDWSAADALIPGVLSAQSIQNAPSSTTITVVEDHLGYIKLSVEGKVYTMERANITVNGVARVGFRVRPEDRPAVLADFNAAAQAGKKPAVTGAPADQAKVTEGFVEISATKSVSIPVDDKGMQTVTITNKADGTVTVTPKEGQILKIDGKEYTGETTLTDSMTGVTTETKPVNPQPTDAIVRASVTGTKVTISAYCGPDGKTVPTLTAADVAKAINAFNGGKYSVAAADVDLVKRTALDANTGATLTFDQIGVDGTPESPLKLFKVTYPGGEDYLPKEGGKLNDVDLPSGHEILILSGEDVQANAADNDGDEIVRKADGSYVVTAELKKDRTYVLAVKAASDKNYPNDGIIKDTAMTPNQLLTVFYKADGEDTVLTAGADGSTAKLIPAGTELILRNKGLKAGATVELKINGKKTTVTANDSGVAEYKFTVESGATKGDDKGFLTFTEAALKATNVKVFLDGKEVSDFTSTGKLQVTRPATGKEIVYQAKSGTLTQIGGGVTSSSPLNKEGLVEVDLTGIPEVDGAVRLFTAYKVQFKSSSTLYTQYSDAACTKALADTIYVKADGTDAFYLKADNVLTNLVVADANKEDLTLTLVKGLKDVTTNGVWKVVVNKSVDDSGALVILEGAKFTGLTADPASGVKFIRLASAIPEGGYLDVTVLVPGSNETAAEITSAEFSSWTTDFNGDVSARKLNATDVKISAPGKVVANGSGEIGSLYVKLNNGMEAKIPVKAPTVAAAVNNENAVDDLEVKAADKTKSVVTITVGKAPTAGDTITFAGDTITVGDGTGKIPAATVADAKLLGAYVLDALKAKDAWTAVWDMTADSKDASKIVFEAKVGGVQEKPDLKMSATDADNTGGGADPTVTATAAEPDPAGAAAITASFEGLDPATIKDAILALDTPITATSAINIKEDDTGVLILLVGDVKIGKSTTPLVGSGMTIAIADEDSNDLGDVTFTANGDQGMVKAKGVIDTGLVFTPESD